MVDFGSTFFNKIRHRSTPPAATDGRPFEGLADCAYHRVIHRCKGLKLSYLLALGWGAAAACSSSYGGKGAESERTAGVGI